MLHACEMNLHYKSSFILLSCIFALAICGSYFELIKNSGQQTREQGTGPFLHKTIFKCDKEPTCTHAIQLDGSVEYVVVHGEDALEKITNTRMIWKKMILNVVRGMQE